MCKFEKIICPDCEGQLEFAGIKEKEYHFRCTHCSWEGNKDFKYVKYYIDYRNLEKHCNLCGALEGALHDYMCDMEICPFCGGQLADCGCKYSKLGYDPQNLPEKIYKKGLNEKDSERFKQLVTEKGRIPNIHYPRICAKCGVLWPILYMVPNQEWVKYIPKGLQKIVLCYDCYNEFKALNFNSEKSNLSEINRCIYCGNENPKSPEASVEEINNYIQPNMRNKILCKKCYKSIKHKIIQARLSVK